MEGSGRVFTAEELDALPRAELVALVTAQASMIELLMARVERLEAEASRDSANSSRPPSGDPQKRRAQRAEAKPKVAGRRRGKQPGAEGHRLAPVADPDARVRHAPQGCRGCGASLADAEVVGNESRQVFDIPEPTPFVTEHTAERRRCSCGQTTTGAFPPEATAPACYGPRLRALAIYMLCRQHLPVQRCAELLSDVIGVPVSTGWLSGLVSEAGTALVPFVGHLSTLLGRSPVVGADETGGRVGVAKRWFHVLCTPTLSLIVCHPSRGKEAVSDIESARTVPPEVAYYYLEWHWRPDEHGWVKSLLLFFDEIALLVPDYKRFEPANLDPTLAGALQDAGLLRIIEPEQFVDAEMTTALAETMVAIIEGGAFDDLSRTEDFAELSMSRAGYVGERDVADEVVRLLRDRQLARETADGLSIPMHPSVRSTYLVLLAQLARRGGERWGLDLHPATNRPEAHDVLTRTLGLAPMPTRGRIVDFDLEVVAVDLEPVPLDEVLAFRTEHQADHRRYMSNLRASDLRKSGGGDC